MKILKWILIVVVLLALGLVVASFFLDKHYEVSRTVTIDAPVAKVHALLSDLKQWEQWQPFTEQDPTIETTLGAKTSGVGAHQSWKGDSGDGELTFTTCDPKQGVLYDMKMQGGEYSSKGGFTYVPQGEKTEVTWSFSGDMETPVIGPLLAASMDWMIDDMFESGLKKLKAAAEQ